MEFLEGLLDQKRIKTPNVLPTHLDAPIKDHMTKLLLGKKEIDKRSPTWKKRILREGQKKLRDLHASVYLDFNPWDIEEGLSSVLKTLYSLKVDLPELHKLEFMEILRNSYDTHRTQMNSLGLKGQYPPIDTLYKSIRKYHGAKELFQQGVLLTGSRTTRVTYPLWGFNEDIKMWTYTQGKVQIAIDSNWIFVIVGAKVSVSTREHLLLLSDVLSQRETLTLYAEIALFSNEVTIPTKEMLDYVFEWGDTLLSIYGNRGYELLAQWESLCVGVLLCSEEDPYWEGEKFLKEMMKEFNEWKGLQEKHRCGNIVNWLKSLAGVNRNLITQLFGLYRIWGHPTVNSEGGIAKLRQHACKLKPLNHQKIMLISCVFKERFCFDYRRQHGKWPALDVSNLSPTSHIRIQIENNALINRREPSYNLLGWNKVKALKTFDILPKYNLVKLLSDKAMSLSRGELIKELQTGTIGAAWKRSVLKNWLESNIGDPEVFLKKIGTEGFGPGEDIVGVCPKEREMKLWARMFGLLTLNKRMYVVLTEAMLSEHILPYFSEITMLDSSTTLMKRMYHSTKAAANFRRVETVELYTSMDFQKWNSNMRKEETEEMFLFFDGLFGLKNCFTRTHEMFEEAQLYLADGTFLPEVDANGKLIEGPLCWSGHLGGIEGLRQKGWTIFTVCIIRAGMDAFDVEFQLMGQGDNQVLKIIYSNRLSPIEIKEMQIKILQHLGDLFQQIGPPIKPSESWTSSKLFIYGKFPIFEGCPLSMSMKKLCRMFPFSNEGYPTLESSLSSISANLMAACNSAIRVDSIFLVYLIQINQCLATHLMSNYLTDFFSLQDHEIFFRLPRTDKTTKKVSTPEMTKFYKRLRSGNHQLFQRILILPRCLGGYPVVLLGTLFSNGFPDPVSENIALLRRIHRTGEFQDVIENILSCKLNDEVSAEMICEDPVALNLLHPSSPKEVLKRMVQSYLGSAKWIKNMEFKSFISLAIGRQKPLCETLLQMTPFCPRIAHAIQEATLVGRAIQVVGQLEKTNTLIRMMDQSSDEDLVTKLIRSDRNYFLSVCFHCSNRGELIWSPTFCSRMWAQTLRDSGWKLTVEGVTVAPIQEAFKIEALGASECDDHLNPELGYFLYTPDASPLEVWIGNEQIGPHDPYIGSQTVEKTQSYGKDLSRDSQPVLRNAAKLLTLINWGTELTSNLSSLILTLFRSLTDIDPTLLIPVASQVAGSHAHRFLDSATKHGGTISVLYSLATHCHLSSNTLTAYKSGAKNVNLHFQALMGIGIVWTSLAFLSGSIPLGTCHFHVDCDQCIIPINEEWIDIAPGDYDDLFPSLPDNPICWVSKERIRMSEGEEDTLSSPIVIPDGYQDIAEVFHQRISQICNSHLRSHLFEQGDNRKLDFHSLNLNMSWISKIDVSLFINHLLLGLCSLYLYSLPASRMSQLTKPANIINAVIRQLEHRPKLAFSWCINLYSSPVIMDQMKSSFCGIPFPAVVPLTKHEATSHFTKLLLWRLTEWEMGDINRPNVKSFYAESSKEVDLHPVFKGVTLNALLSESEEEFKKCIICFRFWRKVLQTGSLTFGNHFDLKKILRAAIMFQPAGSLPASDFPEQLKSVIHYQIIWIQNHPDHLAKQLPSIPSFPHPHPLFITPEAKRKIRGASQVYHPSANPRKIKVSFSHETLADPGTKEIHELRTVRSPTSSWYKLISCLAFLDDPEGTVICLADGSAGFSFLLSRYPSITKVYYNTLFDSSQAMDQMAPNFIPASFIGFPELRDKIISLKNVTEGITDILHPGFLEQLKHALHGSTPSLLTCDAEGSGPSDQEKEMRILQSCMEYGNSLNVKECLIKVYSSSGAHVQVILSLGMSYYHDVSLIKTGFSNFGNHECYLHTSSPRQTVLESRFFKDPVFHYEGWGVIQAECNRIYDHLSTLGVTWDVLRDIVPLCDALTQDDWTEFYNLGLLKLWLGINLKESQTYRFPYDLLRYHQYNISPIRMQRQRRQAGVINLIKFQRLKFWALGWMAVLRVITDKKIEDLRSEGMIVLFKTKNWWRFGMTFKKPLSHPCSKAEDLSNLITSHDIGICYMVSGLLKKYKVSIENRLTAYQNEIDKFSEERGLYLLV